MKNRIFFKLMAAFVLVIAAATFTLNFTIRRAWERSSAARSNVISPRKPDVCQRVQNEHQRIVAGNRSTRGAAAGARATVIDSSGGMCLPTRKPIASTMENHASSPRVRYRTTGQRGLRHAASATLSAFLFSILRLRFPAALFAWPIPWPK